MSDAVIALANVVTPATETLSKFVWPSTSKSVTLIDGLPLNPVAFPVNAPTNDVAVTTPAILTLS